MITSGSTGPLRSVLSQLVRRQRSLQSLRGESDFVCALSANCRPRRCRPTVLATDRNAYRQSHVTERHRRPFISNIGADAKNSTTTQPQRPPPHSPALHRVAAIAYQTSSKEPEQYSRADKVIPFIALTTRRRYGKLRARRRRWW